MGKWDELEEHFRDRAACSNEPVKWHEDVLSLIEQNKRMRQALLELRNHSSVTAHQIEAIDAAIGEDQ